MTGKPDPAMRSAPRTVLSDGTTHVLCFSLYYRPGRVLRLRGWGSWFVMTAADYGNRWHTGCEAYTYARNGPRSRPVKDLTAWVSDLVGYTVVLTRADDIINPEWEWGNLIEPGGTIAYEVRRSP